MIARYQQYNPGRSTYRLHKVWKLRVSDVVPNGSTSGYSQVVLDEIDLRARPAISTPTSQKRSTHLCSDHQLLTKTLKTLSRVTRNEALHFALKPTATMMHAPRPMIETSTRENDQDPWKTNPIKRKMSRIRPASWKLHVSCKSSRKMW